LKILNIVYHNNLDLLLMFVRTSTIIDLWIIIKIIYEIFYVK
jgi:hypothetical protein